MPVSPKESIDSDAIAAVSSRPKYQMVRDRFHADIRAGLFAPGQVMPTEHHFAQSLGVSRSTVRQALAELEQDGIIIRKPGRGTFVATEQQIKSRSQLNVFALIAPRLREGLYPSLIHGFEEASANSDHQVLISNSGNDAARQGDLILQLIDRQIGGVALVPVTVGKTPEYQIRQLQEHRIPVVFCHRPVNGVEAPCLTWEGRDVGKLAAKSLLEKGHRRIALLVSHRQPKINDAIEGLRESFIEAGIDAAGVNVVEYGSPVFLPPDETARAIHTTLAELLGGPNPPTAILCSNLVDAEQVYLHAADFGLKIPGDLSLIYFGGAWRPHGIAQRLNCIAVAEHEIGIRAAEILEEIRSGNRPIDSNEQIMFPVSLLPGETVGQAQK